MADGSTTIQLPISAEALARLKRAEARQRNETKKRGLTAVPVSIEGLLLIQRFRCGCPCGELLDFVTPWDEAKPPESYPVIAHVLARGSRGDHTPRNVQIHRWICNKRDASPDTSGAASVKRHTPDLSRKEAPALGEEFERDRRNPSSWSKPGFRKHATMKRTVSGKVVPR
jgi:hypothetical protein